MKHSPSQRRARRAGHQYRPPSVPPVEAPLDAHSDVRVLMLQNRSLETALEEQWTRLVELQNERDAMTEDPDAISMMLLTIDGMRAGLAGDPAAKRVLSRVEAAIRRLQKMPSTDEPMRPVLPERPSSDCADAATPEPEEPVVSDDTTVIDGPSADPEPLADAAGADTSYRTADNRVLPITADSTEKTKPRKRRWLRGSTHAA